MIAYLANDHLSSSRNQQINIQCHDLTVVGTLTLWSFLARHILLSADNFANSLESVQDPQNAAPDLKPN